MTSTRIWKGSSICADSVFSFMAGSSCQNHGHILELIVGWRVHDHKWFRDTPLKANRHIQLLGCEWQTLCLVHLETFPGFCFPSSNSFPQVQGLWVLWREAIYHGKPKESCWCPLPNKTSEAFLWVRSQGFSLHDVAEFLETDLGKRKLTYVGVTISVVSLWHPLLHNGFFKEKKNGEAPNRSWDLNTFWSGVKFYVTLEAHRCMLWLLPVSV